MMAVAGFGMLQVLSVFPRSTLFCCTTTAGFIARQYKACRYQADDVIR